MNKAVLFFMIMFLFGCQNHPEKKNAASNLEKEIECNIKYPLPSAVDSLLALLKTVPDDTNKINILNAIGWKFKDSNPDTAIILSTHALEIAEKIKWWIGIGKTNQNLGWFSFVKGDYTLSLNHYLKTLELCEKLESSETSEVKNKVVKILKSNTISKMGAVYYSQGNYTKALDYYFNALKLDEELKNQNGIAINFGNIAIVYDEQGDDSKALDYYFEALKMAEKLGNKPLQAGTLGNMGGVFRNRGDFPKALECYFKALSLKEMLGNKNGIAGTLGNIGNAYNSQGDYTNALNYFFKALKMKEKLGDKKGIAIQLGNIGMVYTKTGKYDDAYTYLYRTLVISDSIGAMDNVKSWYEQLSILYEKSTIPLRDSIGGRILNREEMRLRSLHYFKNYINLRDTLFSEENKKQLVRKEMNFVFEKKEAATKSENEKKEALAKEELKQKENERNYFIAGFALVVLLAGFIFRGYRQKQKANEIISLQKNLVEEKQKEILDSLHYAKRIQQSLMPTEKYISKNMSRLKDY